MYVSCMCIVTCICIVIIYGYVSLSALPQNVWILSTVPNVSVVVICHRRNFALCGMPSRVAESAMKNARLACVEVRRRQAPDEVGGIDEDPTRGDPGTPGEVKGTDGDPAS